MKQLQFYFLTMPFQVIPQGAVIGHSLPQDGCCQALSTVTLTLQTCQWSAHVLSS